jgi:cold shock CspA family protein
VCNERQILQAAVKALFDNSTDAFVHVSGVERAGLSGLREGQKVA